MRAYYVIYSAILRNLFYFSRWLRLLFGREFPMQDLLVLWDAIFADGLDRDLVDYLFVSLLVFLREASKCRFSPSTRYCLTVHVCVCVCL